MAEKNAFTLNWRQAIVDVLLIVIGVSIASWRTVLDELSAEQSALRELGTLKVRRIAANIAQESGERFS